MCIMYFIFTMPGYLKLIDKVVSYIPLIKHIRISGHLIHTTIFAVLLWLLAVKSDGQITRALGYIHSKISTTIEPIHQVVPSGPTPPINNPCFKKDVVECGRNPQQCVWNGQKCVSR